VETDDFAFLVELSAALSVFAQAPSAITAAAPTDSIVVLSIFMTAFLSFRVFAAIVAPDC
jgi:hypothetical protein